MPQAPRPVPIMHWEEAEALSFAHSLYPASTLASHSNFSALHHEKLLSIHRFIAT